MMDGRFADEAMEEDMEKTIIFIFQFFIKIQTYNYRDFKKLRVWQDGIDLEANINHIIKRSHFVKIMDFQIKYKELQNQFPLIFQKETKEVPTNL